MTPPKLTDEQIKEVVRAASQSAAMRRDGTTSERICHAIADLVNQHWQEMLAKQEPVACKHEWFRTGAMQPGECRCIHCGKWGNTQSAPDTAKQEPATPYSLHITDPREFAKELARYMRRSDAPLSDHQVITLFHYLEAMSTPDGEQGAGT